MSHDIIIDTDGTTRHLSVDRLRVRNGSGTTDYAPPTQPRYAKLIVYRNGTYNAEDYGLEAFEAVEARVGSRRDGRSCDVVWPEDELSGDSARQVILEGGSAKQFDAKALEVRMGVDPRATQTMKWVPIEAERTPEQGTIQHNGTRRGLYSSVTLDVPESEMEYPNPPECILRRYGDFAKFRARLSNKKTGSFSPISDETRRISHAPYDIYLDCTLVGTIAYAGGVRNQIEYYGDWTRYNYQGNTESAYAWAGFVDYRQDVMTFPDTSSNSQAVNSRRSRYLVCRSNDGLNRMGAISYSGIAKVKLRIRTTMPNCVFDLQQYGVPYDIHPQEDINQEINVQFNFNGSVEEGGYPEHSNVYTDPDSGVKFCVSVNGRMNDGSLFSRRTVVCVRLGIYTEPFYPLGIGAYLRYAVPYSNGSDGHYTLMTFTAEGGDPKAHGLYIPITDLLYVGPADAPDWAKTITDDDF